MSRELTNKIKIKSIMK